MICASVAGGTIKFSDKEWEDSHKKESWGFRTSGHATPPHTTLCMRFMKLMTLPLKTPCSRAGVLVRTVDPQTKQPTFPVLIGEWWEV